MPSIDVARMTIAPVTPSDANTVGNHDALYVQFTGAPGTLALQLVGFSDTITFTITSDIPDIVLPLRVTKVKATGTSGVNVFRVATF